MARSVESRRAKSPTAGQPVPTEELWRRLEQNPPPGVDRAAMLEEMVARTHERAAELYESWMMRRGEHRPEDLERRAQVHRARAAGARSAERLAERALCWFEARIEAVGSATTGKERSLRTLSALERLRGLIDQRIEQCVAVNRREGASWAEVAAALRVRRQTAHQRFR